MIFKNILILTGDRISNDRQCLTLGAAISENSQNFKILFNKYFSLLRFLGHSLLKYGIINYNALERELLKEDGSYEAILCCGSRMAKIGLMIKDQFLPNVKLIQILNPEKSMNKFDVILLPNHDAKDFHSMYQNIIYYRGSLGVISLKSIEEDCKKNEVVHTALSAILRPVIGIFIGGTSKHYNFDITTVKKLIDTIVRLGNSMQASLLISNSRRTGKLATQIIKKEIISDNLQKTYSCYFYDITAKNSQPNPYMEFVNAADFFLVTGDSISMITELMSTGKPIYVFAEGRLSKKYQAFHSEIAVHLGIRFIDDSTMRLQPYSYRQPNDLKRIVAAIKAILDTSEKVA